MSKARELLVELKLGGWRWNKESMAATLLSLLCSLCFSVVKIFSAISDPFSIPSSLRASVPPCLCVEKSRQKKGVSDGGDLLSHTVAHAVPSARAGLTSVFGMGTGVAPLL